MRRWRFGDAQRRRRPPGPARRNPRHPVRRNAPPAHFGARPVEPPVRLPRGTRAPTRLTACRWRRARPAARRGLFGCASRTFSTRDARSSRARSPRSSSIAHRGPAVVARGARRRRQPRRLAHGGDRAGAGVCDVEARRLRRRRPQGRPRARRCYWDHVVNGVPTVKGGALLQLLAPNVVVAEAAHPDPTADRAVAYRSIHIDKPKEQLRINGLNGRRRRRARRRGRPSQ